MRNLPGTAFSVKIYQRHIIGIILYMNHAGIYCPVLVGGPIGGSSAKPYRGVMLVLKSTVDDEFLTEQGIISGSKLLKVNGEDICDILDWEYYASSDELILLFESIDGEMIELEIEPDDLIELELEFEQERVKVCRNQCVFCFIYQLPKGLRRALYVKDEDYRLSFRYGNYITLTNLTEADFERIERQRLSPLYISVHTTNEPLRSEMLGRDDIPELAPQISRLVDAGIELHTQIVLCPGINDGDELERTIIDLKQYHPGVGSVAVVPVGLTTHRDRLPKLDPVTPEIAARVLDRIDSISNANLRDIGTRFVYPADEFFILADRPIPEAEYYGDFPQVENGVGMVRQLLDSEPAEDIEFDPAVRITVCTGTLIENILSSVLAEKWRDVRGLSWEIIPVRNILLGESVTVSALLSGGDIEAALKQSNQKSDIVIVPPDSLNDDGLFLDDMTLADLESEFGMRFVEAEYSPAATLVKLKMEYGL